MDRSKVLTQWPAFRGKWRAGEVLRGGLSRIALRVSSCHPLRGDDGSCCQPGALSERVGQCPVPVEGGRPTPAHAGRHVWPVASSRVPCSDGTGPGRRLMPVLSARIQSCAGKRPAGGGPWVCPDWPAPKKPARRYRKMQAESRERPGGRWHGANASSKCVPGEPGVLSDFQGFHVPDLVGVLQDRAVAGEDAHAGNVDHGLPVPGVLVAV